MVNGCQKGIIAAQDKLAFQFQLPVGQDLE